MRLPIPPAQYDQRSENERNTEIEREDNRNAKLGTRPRFDDVTLARSTNAVGDEVVRGDDTRLGAGTPGTVTSVSGSGGTTGLIVSGGPITTAGTLTLNGILNIANGGTGAASSAAARGTLGAGTVNSVSGAGGTTGLTLAGGPITNTGTLTLGGTLAIANGGTSATSAAAARTALGAGTGNGSVTSVDGTGGTTGLTLTGGPITGSGTLTIGGILNIANGGTGAASAASARGTLGAGTVNSVSGSGGTTGLTLTGGPITGSGTLTLGGTLGVANGGTGVTTGPVDFNAGTFGATGTVDFNTNGRFQHFVTTSATNCTISLTAPATVGYLQLIVAAPAGVTPTLTWPATVKGTMPPTVALGKVTALTLYWNGTNYFLMASLPGV